MGGVTGRAEIRLDSLSFQAFSALTQVSRLLEIRIRLPAFDVRVDWLFTLTVASVPERLTLVTVDRDPYFDPFSISSMIWSSAEDNDTLVDPMRIRAPGRASEATASRSRWP